MDKHNDVFDRLVWPLYFVALLLVATPFMDFFAGVWPLQLGSVRWRFGAAGLLSASLLTSILGLTLAVVTAAFVRHGGILRAAGMLALLGALLLLVATAGFALDALELRRQVRTTVTSVFDDAALRAVAKHLSGALALLWLGLASLGAARSLAAKRARRREEPVPLVVGDADSGAAR